MSFGTRLKDKRKELGITQPQLAKMLNVSQSAIGSWETDTNSPHATILYKLFDILHCDVNYLFQDETVELYKDKAIPEEFENIIQKYRDLDNHGRKMVNFTLQEEWERSTCKIAELASHLMVNAARECTNIEVTDEMRNHDDDIKKSGSECMTV